jgi:peptidoglycan hydrolase CwlO-like protein
MVEVRKTARSVTKWVGSTRSIAVHTVIFLASFAAAWTGLVDVDRMLLVLTTLVSLEAIYLAIFIQMTINEQAADIDEIQEDIDEIQEDVQEMQEDVEEMSEEDKAEEAQETADRRALDEIRLGLSKLMKDIEGLQKH